MTQLKLFGSLLLAGLIPPVGLAIFMNFVSFNLSFAVLFGAGVLWAVSYWKAGHPSPILLKLVVIALPITLLFAGLIVLELPGLWIVLPLFVITTAAGLYSNKPKRTYILGGSLLFLSIGISFLVIPQRISDDLSEVVNAASPQFILTDLNTSQSITNNSLEGKVVVLDFFGTWCAPCIDEMKELDRIRQAFTDSQEEVEFIIACTDTGGDTPDKALRFHTQRALAFRLAYDESAEVHRSFDFSGVPGLVILDKKGRIRFKHEGYNQAEDLQAKLIPIIKQLLSE